jgi:hypothetical protein
MSKKDIFNLIGSLLVAVVVWYFFFYPAFVCIKLASNPVLHGGGIPDFVFSQFEKTSLSYKKWAEDYLKSHKAESFGSDCSPDTEWPVFGSAYYLLTAEEIVKKLEDKEDPASKRIKKIAKEASKTAAEVLADSTLKDNGYCLGFGESTDDYQNPKTDEDEAIVIKDYRYVQTVFSIGAARANGRINHSCPLTMEVVACSWPTPFGLIVARLLSYASCKSACLGEVALLFLMTRPIANNQITVYEGRMPMLVNVIISFYLIFGILILLPEIILWNKWLKKRKK